MSSIDEPKEVTELRKSLLAWNGIPQLEMCEPHEIDNCKEILQPQPSTKRWNMPCKGQP